MPPYESNCTALDMKIAQFFILARDSKSWKAATTTVTFSAIFISSSDISLMNEFLVEMTEQSKHVVRPASTASVVRPD